MSPFKTKHCVKCKESSWSAPDHSVGIMGPTLEDCRADVCPFGNVWEDYMDDNIDYESEAEEWD